MSEASKQTSLLRRSILGAYVCGGLILACGAIVHAQSSRSYSTAKVWWDAGRGLVFPRVEQYDDPTGELTIMNADGVIRPDGHPFFEALGSNGRACITCHQPANAMGLAAATIQQRWLETDGHDPLFSSIDGSNCPDLNPLERSSHSLLIEKGLFRLTSAWPPKATGGATIKPEIEIQVERDPTGCNTSSVHGLKSPHPTISVYRRPRVVANLKLATMLQLLLMADGRETSLRGQAITAIQTHEQSAAPPADKKLDAIVAFENQVFAAQSSDLRGGLLYDRNGPESLGAENLALRKAGLFSGTPTPRMPSFHLWRKATEAGEADLQETFRASVARGNDIFYVRTFPMRGLAGFKQGSVGTCASCHSGGAALAMNIGTTNVVAQADDSPELPLFRVTCKGSPDSQYGRTILTHDPGRALVTGKCADVGSIVMQQLRGLSARPPYFSNGSAKTLPDLIDFYDRRFGIGYSAQEKQDLLNFLSVL